MTEAVQEKRWSVFEPEDLSFGGHDPEQLSAELIVLDIQKEGTWCTGRAVLQALKAQKVMLMGAASKPEHFPAEWREFQIAVFGTQYTCRDDRHPVPHVCVYAYKDGAWTKRMKSFDDDFNVRVHVRQNLRIPIFTVLT